MKFTVKETIRVTDPGYEEDSSGIHLSLENVLHGEWLCDANVDDIRVRTPVTLVVG